MSVETSQKLLVNEFAKSAERVPIQCYHQVQNSDSYSSNGYSFYIKSPAQGALLDPNIWIYYQINLVDTGGAGLTLANNYETVADANDDIRGAYARTNVRYALRSGNIMQRATTNISVIINGHSINCEPWKFVEELNRLYISNEQSRHEFSASGGMFDSGNHSSRTSSDCHASGQNSAVTDARMAIHVYNGFHSNAIAMPTQAVNAQNLVNAINPVPFYDYFINDGYNDRYMKLADILRRSQAPNAAYGLRFSPANANQTYTLDIFERLCIPPFKMYSNDHFNSPLPHIKDLTIRGQFTSNLAANILRTSVAGNVNVTITSSSTNCQLFLKWYTPPADLILPKEISIPLRKINCYYKNQTLTVPLAASNSGELFTVSESNISLDGVPDLLLIYCKIRVDSNSSIYPDSSHMEILNLQLNLEGSSGKVNQIQTIQLYDNWKRLLKYKDSKIAPYDEWRKYMCIAALIPEDYGVIKGPGYDNPITLGVNFSAKNWWNIPAMGGGAAGASAERITETAGELIVVSIFDHWSLTLRESGSAESSLTRIVSPYMASPASIGLSQLEPMSSRMGIRGLL